MCDMVQAASSPWSREAEPTKVVEEVLGLVTELVVTVGGTHFVLPVIAQEDGNAEQRENDSGKAGTHEHVRCRWPRTPDRGTKE